MNDEIEKRDSETLCVWKCAGDVHWICECKLAELNKYKAGAELSASQTRASVAEEKRLCDLAFHALASARIPTPVEGFGTNTSWAIQELVSAVNHFNAMTKGRRIMPYMKMKPGMMYVNESNFPKVFRCLNEISYDNGMVNRIEPQKTEYEVPATCAGVLKSAEFALASLDDEQISEFCTGEQKEIEAYVEKNPALSSAHKFLNAWFNGELS